MIALLIYSNKFEVRYSYDSESCHAALRTQSLKRVYNLYSLGGPDLIWQIKYGFFCEWIETSVINGHLTHISLVCFYCA